MGRSRDECGAPASQSCSRIQKSQPDLGWRELKSHPVQLPSMGRDISHYPRLVPTPSKLAPCPDPALSPVLSPPRASVSSSGHIPGVNFCAWVWIQKGFGGHRDCGLRWAEQRDQLCLVPLQHHFSADPAAVAKVKGTKSVFRFWEGKAFGEIVLKHECLFSLQSFCCRFWQRFFVISWLVWSTTKCLLCLSGDFLGVFSSHPDSVFTPVRCIGTNSNRAIL